MKPAFILGSIISLISLNSFAADVSWEEWRGSRGWGVDSPYQRKYDPKNVIMISGIVVGIKQIVPIKRVSPGIILQLKTEKGTIPVHLGPVWYIEKLDYRISVGDKLEVKGVKTLFSAREAVIAAEVRIGNRFLILRDNSGIPVWSGWGWKK